MQLYVAVHRRMCWASHGGCPGLLRQLSGTWPGAQWAGLAWLTQSYLGRMTRHPHPLQWSSYWHLAAGHLQVKAPRTPPAQRSRRPSTGVDAAEPKDASYVELHTPTLPAYHAMVHAYSVAGDLRCALSSPANRTRNSCSHVAGRFHLIAWP